MNQTKVGLTVTKSQHYRSQHACKLLVTGEIARFEANVHIGSRLVTRREQGEEVPLKVL